MQHIVGDRVSREIDIFDPGKGLKLGAVINAYSRPMKKVGSLVLGPYSELYDVEWDDGWVEKGFLPHGISAT